MNFKIFLSHKNYFLKNDKNTKNFKNYLNVSKYETVLKYFKFINIDQIKNI